MRKIHEILRVCNSCLINSNPPYPPNIDEEKMKRLLSDQEFKLLDQLVKQQPPGIDSYRGKFYSLEYKSKTTMEGKSSIIIMRDDRDDVHSIFTDGKITWTKEL